MAVNVEATHVYSLMHSQTVSLGSRLQPCGMGRICLHVSRRLTNALLQMIAYQFFVVPGISFASVYSHLLSSSA